MRNATKMLMVASAGKETDRDMRPDRAREVHDRYRESPEMGAGYGAYMTYGTENRYPNYPRGDMDEPESRRYRRYSDGRFRPKAEMIAGKHEEDMDMHYPNPYPFLPPVYENKYRDNSGWNNRGTHETPRMNRIGFDVNSNRELSHNYREDATYQPRNETEHRSFNSMMGGAKSNVRKFDKETAEEWTAAMVNDDGTKGPHWTMEQTNQVARQRNIDCDPNEFYTAMNYMYSDFYKVAKKHNVNSVDFYADMAKAFLTDKDAADNKLALYYEYIVEH